MSGDFCFCSGGKRTGPNLHADVICYNSLLLSDYCMSHVVRSRKCVSGWEVCSETNHSMWI